MALGARRLCLLHGIGKCLDVFDELVFGELSLADRGLDDARLLYMELFRTALGTLHGSGDVHRHCADLGVWHDATGTEHLTEATDQRHHVWCGDTAIEVDLAFVDLLDQVLGADDVGTRGLRLVRLAAARKHADAQRAATPRTI